MHEDLRTLFLRIGGFADFFNSRQWLYRQPNLEVTVHGLCLLAADFVLAGVRAGVELDLRELADFVESHCDGEDSVLKNAILTCLLEPLKGSAAELLLGPRARDYLAKTRFA
jgi:hypothetical protein